MGNHNNKSRSTETAEPFPPMTEDEVRQPIHGSEDHQIKLKRQNKELHRAQEEIQDAREYAENIVETMIEPLVVLSFDLKILTANHSFYHTFKVTAEETIGNFIYDLGNGQWDIPRLRVLLEKILPNDTVIHGYEVEHDFLDIGRKVILLNARQIFRKTIGSHIILLAMEDITDRRRAEDAVIGKNRGLEVSNMVLEERVHEAIGELRQKDHLLMLKYRQALMGEMINNIAHHWRQPLNKLGLVVQQVPLYHDSGELNSEFVNRNTAKAMELIKGMSQSIDDLRNFFRSDQEAVPFSVNDVITSTISLIEPSFEDQKIHLAVDPEGNPLAHGYPIEYSQVLLNILLNARDALVAHNGENARISIHSFAEEGASVVTISDNGGGIPEEILDRLFDPYFTTKGPDKGSGIGLFMSRTIIEKNMGGRLTVRNTGSGAEFRIQV